MEKQFTATGIIFNASRTKTLLIKHRKHIKWMPPGGHLENNETPDEAVLREIKEEAGLLATFIQFESQIKITSQATETALQTPIQVLREEIPEHDGKPQHVHIDFIYILEADDEQALAGEEEGKWYVKDELEALDMYKATKDLCLKFIK